MYNNKIIKIIKSKNIYNQKFFLHKFSKCEHKYKFIFNSFKNFEKKILTNLCLHQNKFKTINNFQKMNRHEMLFKITFNNCREYTKQ